MRKIPVTIPETISSHSNPEVIITSFSKLRRTLISMRKSAGQQPAPILARLAQSAYEMSAIVIGDNCDDSITSSTADSHDCQKSPEAVVRSTCRPEKHACRKWKWYRCRSGESTGSPFVKKAEN